jgi:MSHA biogenesis protein MshI
LLSLERMLPGWLRMGSSRPHRLASVYMSSTAVAVAKGEQTENGFQVDLRANVIESLPHAREMLKQQSHDVGLKDTVCNLVLASELYSLSLVEKPPVSEEELNDAVRWRIQENVDFPVDEAAIDTFELPESAVRDTPMVFVAAMRKDLLKVLLDKVHEAGIHVDSVNISELALRNIVHGLFPEPDQGVALLRLTSYGGMINVSRGEELFLSRRVSGVPGDFDEKIWDEYRERLLLQVQRSIDYYESAMSQPPCSGLIVATTHGWVDHVCDHLGEMLPLPVRPIKDELRALFDIRLHDPEPQEIDWDDIQISQRNAMTLALPALGGLLRSIRDSSNRREAA